MHRPVYGRQRQGDARHRPYWYPIEQMSKVFDLSLQQEHPLATRIFERALATGKLAHAYLLTGPAVQDKWACVLALAAHLNCRKLGSQGTSGVSCLVGACDRESWCADCQWLSQRQHPGVLHLLDGEGRSGKVPVEKVRKLAFELAKVSTYNRVIVIPDAGEAIFHRAAANALLKSIEEPPAGTIYFLFAESSENVLSTVLSRCQVIPLHTRKGFLYDCGYEIDVESGHDAACYSDESGWKEALKGTMQAVVTAVETNFAGAGGAGKAAGWQSVGCAQNLARELVKAGEELAAASAEAIDREQAAAQVLDMVAAHELAALSQAACENAALSAYLSRLINRVDEAKQQIKQYVKPASVFESFCLDLFALRARHSGEPSLAKH